ncbi:MAG: branched-chain amino acid ABC transporter permease [Armatimonadota bacterium]|nr:branched-chain amino acid ABC transporter permease [Armatimonadota bacterium]MDR5675028.1 branched-chain amino acid ABC transporter permease [Armatimonadota bacterium]MDR5689078.1 branched-chain amino acid ABC transporter permease [Armatimonadota bacterium]MDR7389621.1 branched-chain amino acid ABC transporter permease [Armatimonadota bacterium]MDR7390569.1 branched-chain amino acid ABC transporter permease [Armatimonadota bacterium]
MWRVGLVFGAVAWFVSLVGLVEALHGRWVVDGVLSAGQVLLLAVLLASGWTAARRFSASLVGRLWAGLLAGATVGFCVGLLVWLRSLVDLRTMFVNASPALFQLLSGGQPARVAWAAAVAVGAGVGLVGGAGACTPARVVRPILVGAAAALSLALFQELVLLVLQPEPLAPVRDWLFVAGGGPTAQGIAATFAFSAALAALRQASWGRAGRVALPPKAQRVLWSFVGVLLLAALPIAGGPFVAQVLVIVGLYTLMGLGLNLEVGLAGLLDLGFVAFFAIGAYTVGLLTSVGDHGIAHWSFWAAVPVAVLVSLIAGVILGIPVLGIRGDYLAIATLGFGEIVRLLVLSDALRPWFGGSQGVLAIPKPVLAGFEFSGPQHLYYLTVVASAVVAYVAWRLQDSRLGRAWMAIREDEDVAEALGINLVSVKLLAYGLGAAFAGVGGAIFAVMVGSVFPHSFQLLISIQVLALIIVGGMGSIPGVIVGSAVLIGLPELLREFGEFRFLVYGAVLVAMMLLRPEGLLPAAAQRRELHAAEEEPAGLARTPVGAATEGGA